MTSLIHVPVTSRVVHSFKMCGHEYLLAIKDVNTSVVDTTYDSTPTVISASKLSANYRNFPPVSPYDRTSGNSWFDST